MANMGVVTQRIAAAASGSGRSPGSINLVAVSKTKPASDIQALYDAGHRHFGENYFQELVEKSAILPRDIVWHFIGHLQSSKAPKLIREVPNLGVLETLDSLKLGQKLHNACVSVGRESLDVLVQVDTSGEDTKSGVDVAELTSLVQALSASCPTIRLKGVMTSKLFIFYSFFILAALSVVAAVIFLAISCLDPHILLFPSQLVLLEI